MISDRCGGVGYSTEAWARAVKLKDNHFIPADLDTPHLTDSLIREHRRATQVIFIFLLPFFGLSGIKRAFSSFRRRLGISAGGLRLSCGSVKEAEKGSASG